MKMDCEDWQWAEGVVEREEREVEVFRRSLRLMVSQHTLTRLLRRTEHTL
jgi:hypothetical protein